MQNQIAEAIALLEADPLGNHRTSLVRGTLDRIARELAVTIDERTKAQHACELMGRRITRLEDHIRVLLDNDPNADAADTVSVFDVWSIEAERLLRYDDCEK